MMAELWESVSPFSRLIPFPAFSFTSLHAKEMIYVSFITPLLELHLLLKTHSKPWG